MFDEGHVHIEEIHVDSQLTGEHDNNVHVTSNLRQHTVQGQNGQLFFENRRILDEWQVEYSSWFAKVALYKVIGAQYSIPEVESVPHITITHVNRADFAHIVSYRVEDLELMLVDIEKLDDADVSSN